MYIYTHKRAYVYIYKQTGLGHHTPIFKRKDGLGSIPHILYKINHRSNAKCKTETVRKTPQNDVIISLGVREEFFENTKGAIHEKEHLGLKFVL